MASETVDPIDWSHPPPSWSVPPELHVLYGVNAAYKSQDLVHNRNSHTRLRECQTNALPVRPLMVNTDYNVVTTYGWILPIEYSSNHVLPDIRFLNMKFGWIKYNGNAMAHLPFKQCVPIRIIV